VVCKKRKMNPISLNLTIHNKEVVLEDALRRIKLFTSGAYELICVLDGCTDRSEEILNEFIRDNKDLSIKVIYADDVFETKANNLAAKISSGDYIIIIQDDICLNEDKWNERLLKPFNIRNVFAVTGNCSHNWVINPKSKHIYEDIRDDCWCDIINHVDHANRHSIPRDIFAVRDCVNRAPLAINRADLETMNYFDEIYSPQEMDDHDLCLRVKEKLGKIVGCYWIDFICNPAWGGTRGEDLQPKPWLFRANHRSVRIFLDRHRKYLESGKRTIKNIKC
jgi:glycosyltransferase involved in cell wall biosynthesis